MKDLCQKWKEKLIFETLETVWWLDLTDPWRPPILRCHSGTCLPVWCNRPHFSITCTVRLRWKDIYSTIPQYHMHKHIPEAESLEISILVSQLHSIFWGTCPLGSCVGSNLQVGAECRRKAPADFFLDVPPLFSCAPPPHMRAHNDCLLPTERQLVSPSVRSAVYTSVDVGRGAIKIMGPSAVPCRLLGY